MRGRKGGENETTGAPLLLEWQEMLNNNNTIIKSKKDLKKLRFLCSK